MNTCVIIPLTYSHVDILEMDITADVITVDSEGKLRSLQTPALTKMPFFLSLMFFRLRTLKCKMPDASCKLTMLSWLQTTSD